jgi:hypothetical protein
MASSSTGGAPSISATSPPAIVCVGMAGKLFDSIEDFNIAIT